MVEAQKKLIATATTVRWSRQYITEGSKTDRKSTRLNSSHSQISYAVFCLKKKKMNHTVDSLINANPTKVRYHACHRYLEYLQVHTRPHRFGSQEQFLYNENVIRGSPAMSS